MAKLTKRENTLFEALTALLEALREAQGHLEYCGYGDKWERECAKEAKLEQKIQAAIDVAEKIVEEA